MEQPPTGVQFRLSERTPIELGFGFEPTDRDLPQGIPLAHSIERAEGVRLGLPAPTILRQRPRHGVEMGTVARIHTAPL